MPMLVQFSPDRKRRSPSRHAPFFSVSNPVYARVVPADVASGLILFFFRSNATRVPR